MIVMFENNKLCLQNVLLELFCNMFRRVPEVGNIIIFFSSSQRRRENKILALCLWVMRRLEVSL